MDTCWTVRWGTTEAPGMVNIYIERRESSIPEVVLIASAYIRLYVHLLITPSCQNLERSGGGWGLGVGDCWVGWSCGIALSQRSFQGPRVLFGESHPPPDLVLEELRWLLLGLQVRCSLQLLSSHDF